VANRLIEVHLLFFLWVLELQLCYVEYIGKIMFLQLVLEQGELTDRDCHSFGKLSATPN
jgi:hypothetical protein